MTKREGEDWVVVKLPEGAGSVTLVDGPFAVKLEGPGPQRITRMEYEHFSRRKGGAPFRLAAHEEEKAGPSPSLGVTKKE